MLICFGYAADGHVVWQKNVASETKAKRPTWGFAGSPLVIGGTLFVNVGAHGTALDKKSGKILWSTGREAASYSSIVPHVRDGRQELVMFAHKALVGKTKTWIRRPAAFKSMRGSKHDTNGFDGNTGRATLKCIKLANGKVQWEEDRIQAIGKKLLIISNQGELVAGPTPVSSRHQRAQVTGPKCGPRQCWQRPNLLPQRRPHTSLGNNHSVRWSGRIREINF